MKTEEKLKLAIDTLREVLRVESLPVSGQKLIERNETIAASEIVLSGLELSTNDPEAVPRMQVICPACDDRKKVIMRLKAENIQLAKLATSTPLFNTHEEIDKATAIRDRILEEIK